MFAFSTFVAHTQIISYFPLEHLEKLKELLFLINAILGQLKKKKKEFQILALHKSLLTLKKENWLQVPLTSIRGVCSGLFEGGLLKLNFINFGVCMNSWKSNGQCGAAINHKRRAALGAVVWCCTDGSSKARLSSFD